MAPDDPNFFPGDYACKHCDQRGKCCENCDEEGCDECQHQGVIPLTPSEHVAGVIMARWESWVAQAEQASQTTQDSRTGEAMMQQRLIDVIEEVYPPAVEA